MAVLARVKTDRKALAPFPECAALLPILDRPLADLQMDEANAASLTIVDIGRGDTLPADTRVVIDDDTFASSELLLALKSEIAPRRVVIARDTSLHRRMSPFAPKGATSDDGGLIVPLSATGGQVRTASVEDPVENPIFALTDDGHTAMRVAPFGRAPHMLDIPDVKLLAGRVGHWLHLLEMNLAFLSLTRRRLGLRGRKSRVGKKSKIHSTALVEGSVIDDGAEIEAGASVLNSYIGKSVKVAAHTVIADSVIGHDCHTLIDTHLRRVVALEGSTLSNIGTSDALFGREIFITTGVQFFPGTPGMQVVVGDVDTGRPILSGVVGHHAILGARALFDVAAVVPGHAVIVMRPDEGVAKLDDDGLRRASMQRGDPARDV